jgi:hypothetical protein
LGELSPARRDHEDVVLRSYLPLRSALNRFVRNNPHLEVMSALREHMGATRFIDWQARGAQLPPTWTDAMARFQKESGIG